MIRPAQLKQAVSFYEEPARLMLAGFESERANPCLRNNRMFLKPEGIKLQ